MNRADDNEQTKYILSVYCGLGHSVGKPWHSTDRLCMVHDEWYGELINEHGITTYFQWNEADEWFLNQLKKITPKEAQEYIVHQVSKGIFALKKNIALNGNLRVTPQKQPQSLWNPTHDFIEVAVAPSGEATLGNTHDYITPDRPAKRAPNLSPGTRHPHLESILDAIDDEDLNLAVQLMQSLSNSLGTTQDAEGNMSGLLKETPITKATPHYSFQNTETVIMPVNYVWSVANCKHDRFYMIHFRMTTPYDIVRTTPKSNYTHGESIASTVEGIQQGVVSSGREFAWQGEPPNTSTTANTNYTFWGLTDNPYKLTDKSGYPYMRKYYEDRYKYYTVLGCEWELTVTNVSEEPGADAMVGHLYTNEIKPPNEALPSNVDTESKLIPGAESMYWKGIKHDVVNSDKGNNGLNNQVTIRGKFKTGQSRSEIATDDKVETWTERHFTPKLQEDLTLMFFKHPAAYCHSTAGPYLNCYLRMKYIVQWKELTSALKYISNAEIMGEPERSVWRNTAIAYDTVETAIRDTSVTGTRNDGNRAQYTREAALTDDKVDDNEVSDLVQSS